MALSATPPWLNISPDTFIGASAAGGRLGATVRAQDLKQEQLADRLQLAYDQLGAKEQAAGEALKNRQMYQNALLDLRQQGLALEDRAITDRWMLGQGRQNRPQFVHGADGALYRVGDDGQLALVETGKAAKGPTVTITVSRYNENIFKPLGYNIGDVWHGTADEYKQLVGQTPQVSAAPAPGTNSLMNFFKRMESQGEDTLKAQNASDLTNPPPSLLAKTVYGALVPQAALAEGIRKIRGIPPVTTNAPAAAPPVATTNAPVATAPAAGTAPAPVLTDSQGRKWQYLGDMTDPKQDRDKSHWKRVE